MKPNVATLLSIKQQAENVLAFTFEYPNLKSAPGQFVMIWLPDIDQKPFSIAADTGKTFTVVVFKVKHFTSELFKLKPGSKVGVTGPFGNPFTWKKASHIIAVGGGYGSAPLAYLINSAKKDDCTYELITGAKTKSAVLYGNTFPKSKTFVTTDDGSEGTKGFVTHILENRLSILSKEQQKKTCVYICGPELMELAAVTLCKKYAVHSQVSVERYIKCGFGVCGQCCMDDTGEPMCTVGPVITGEHALTLKEFGKYHRDKTGMKV